MTVMKINDRLSHLTYSKAELVAESLLEVDLKLVLLNTRSTLYLFFLFTVLRLHIREIR